MPDTTNLSTLISGEAIVKSTRANRVSLLDPKAIITPDTVKEFNADPAYIVKVVSAFKKAGFTVLGIGKSSVGIMGSIDLFQTIFNTTLEDASNFQWKGSDTPLCLDTSQSTDADLKNCLDGIVFPMPVEYCAVSATPPAKQEAWFLNLDDVALKLNVSDIHKFNVKGEKIRIVLIDTGLYLDHPYFKANYPKLKGAVMDFVVNIKLDHELAYLQNNGARYLDQITKLNSSLNLSIDSNGHGTAMMANTLIVAPKAEVVMIKYTDESSIIPSFQKAMELSPHIISCSWGNHNDINSTTTEAYNLMIALFQNAIQQNITVLFAAGNFKGLDREFSKPSAKLRSIQAQIPEVIAVGGAYYDDSTPSNLLLSNYACGFVSQLDINNSLTLPRIVPDICGLCGPVWDEKEPDDVDDRNGAYISLPTQPGCEHPPDNSGWLWGSGTSSATAQLAGVCALIKQVYPGASPAEVKSILMTTGVTISGGTSAQGYSLAQLGNPRFADAYAAVTKALQLRANKVR